MEFGLAADRYIACQEYAKTAPGDLPVNPVTKMPFYSIGRILDLGVSAGNTCGKFREKAKPGELIFFVKPRSFLEKMRQ